MPRCRACKALRLAAEELAAAEADEAEQRRAAEAQARRDATTIIRTVAMTHPLACADRGHATPACSRRIAVSAVRVLPRRAHSAVRSSVSVCLQGWPPTTSPVRRTSRTRQARLCRTTAAKSL